MIKATKTKGEHKKKKDEQGKRETQHGELRCKI
jgi:hypothetical protein